MINLIPGIGWLFSLYVAACMAVPFWATWTWYGIGARYAYWLPTVYQAPSFLDCIAVFIAMAIIKKVFVPTIASVSQTNNAS